MTLSDTGLVLDPSLGADSPTVSQQGPTDGVVEPLYQPVGVLDLMAGMCFWWDSAPAAKRRFYHGRIMGSIEGGYYLVAFSLSPDLPTGIHEVVHVSTMVGDNWSLYRTVEELAAAMVPKDDPE